MQMEILVTKRYFNAMLSQNNIGRHISDFHISRYF